MGRFYCDYCHCYLTHDSASVRKAHNLGRNHLQQVREYYQKLGFEKTQSVIDSLTQDYQSQVLQATTPNPFAAGLAGGRPGFPPMGGMPFTGPTGFTQPPLPGMPLPPPPGMPLPGGQTAQMPGGLMPPPGFAMPPLMGGMPGMPPVAPNAGGRMEQ